MKSVTGVTLGNDAAGAHVINPFLYEKLQKRFGDVIIAKQGEPIYGNYTYDGSGFKYDTLGGEYYRVCCPFCEQKRAVDTKHRLWISHRWGVGLDEDDPQTKLKPNDRFWWAWVCYNEHCEENPANTKQLQTWVYGGIGRELHAPAVKLQFHTVPMASLGLVDWPGRCLRVDQLRPEHHAWQYLATRGFDPAAVGPRYGVTYCESGSARFPMAFGRLVIPIVMNGDMVGWQARPPYEADWKTTAKYYNCPGINRRLMLYGFDIARAYPYCVITEGVTDVWAVGQGAISLLGKHISPQQAELIAQNWKAAVIALDPDAMDRVERIQQQLGSMPTVVVKLPDGCDPADMDQDRFWDLVWQSSVNQNVDLLGLQNDS